MKAEFKEAYNKLSDMMPGNVAASKDRKQFFVCGFARAPDGTGNIRVILEVNNLSNQYIDKRDMSQPVKILKHGDKFVCEA